MTAIDISPKSVTATRARLALKDIAADVRELDAETLDLTDEFDFIWSWGVIPHSARTGRVLRNLYNALKPGGQLRFMVDSLDGMQSYAGIVSRYLVGFYGAVALAWTSCCGRTPTTSWRATSTKDSLLNLCRTFFDDVDLQVFGLEADAVPLPSALRRLVRPFVSDRYIEQAVRRRGTFLFATATKQAGVGPA